MSLDFDKLLKQYAGFDDKTGNKWTDFLTLEEDEGNWFLYPIRDLDTETQRALLKFATEYNGGYEPKTDEHTRRYWIPKTPSPQAMDSQATYKEAGNETPYNLETSMRGLGQLVPVLEDAQGNIIDGFHRVEIDKKWPRLKIAHINNTVKLELARLATNYCRRTMLKEELEQKIGFLIGAGLTVQQISLQTGMSERSIYRYMPETLKKPSAEKISEAMKVTSDVVRKELTAVSSYPKTQETFVPTPAFEEAARTYMNDVVECGKCHLKVHKSRMVEGLCPQCATKAGISKPEVVTPQVPKPFKPKETGDFRKAQMQPQKSKFELAVIQELQAEGLPLETDQEFCVQKTIPDAILKLKDKTIAVYIDNVATHEEGNERDEFLRSTLEKLYGFKVCVVQYKNDSAEERQRAKETIKEFLRW